MYYQKQADAEQHLYFARYADGHYDHYKSLPHFHSSLEIYVVASGEYDVSIGGERRHLRAGEIAFVDRFVPHNSGRLPAVDAEVFVLVASDAYTKGIGFLDKQTLPAFTEEREDFARILELVRLAYDAPRDEEVMRGFVVMLLGLLKGYCGTQPRTGERHTRVLADVMRYINDHYAEEISLTSLSLRFGYAPSYLSRLFNQSLNMNLREYLNRIRVSAVKRLREENPILPLSLALFACGFQNENTYYRALRRYGKE